MFLMATALINGTHGLGFALKLGLMGIVLSDTCILLIAVCGNTSAIVIACAETYHTAHRAFAFTPSAHLPSVLFVPVAQGSLPWLKHRIGVPIPGVPHTASHHETCAYYGTTDHCSLSNGSGRHRCRRRAPNPTGPNPNPESESKLKP